VVIGNGQQNLRAFVMCLEIRPGVSILRNGAQRENTDTHKQ